MRDNDRIKMATPDDQAEMNEFAAGVLNLCSDLEIDKSAACSVMLHIIAAVIIEKEAIETYSQELLKVWETYQSSRNNILKNLKDILDEHIDS